MLISRFDAKLNHFIKIKDVDLVVYRFKYNNVRVLTMISDMKMRQFAKSYKSVYVLKPYSHS
jgi:hypothetical protein